MAKKKRKAAYRKEPSEIKEMVTDLTVRGMPPEYEGEGLQEPSDDQTVLFEESLTIDIRFSYQSVDKAIVELALKGYGHNFRFVVEDIPLVTVHGMTGVMHGAATNEREIVTSLANLLVPRLIGSINDRNRSKNALKHLQKFTESQLKGYLRLARHKNKLHFDPRGFLWTEIEDVGGGRYPESSAEKEADKKQFLSDVFEAFDQIKSEGGKQTQLDVGMILFGGKGFKDVESLVKNRCQKFGLEWENVKKEYRQQKSVKN